MADDTAHIAPGPEHEPFASDTRTPISVSEPDAVLVGAASTAPTGESSASGLSDRVGATPPARFVPGFGTADDGPTWSFREASTPRAATLPAPVDRNQVELLFTPAKETAAPPPRPQPTFGPVGTPRSGLVVALLATVTLGVYALVWHHRVNRELEDFDPKLHARPMRSTVAVAVPWLVGLLISLAGAVLIVSARLSLHLPLDTHLTQSQEYYLLAGLALVPYLTLIVPYSLVAVVMTLERLRSVEEHVGATTDCQVRPVRMTLLLAVPIVGGLVLLGVAQRRINSIWDAVALTGRRSS